MSILTVVILVHTLLDGSWNNAEIRFIFASLGLYALNYVFFKYKLANFQVLVLVNSLFSILIGVYILYIKSLGQDIVTIFQGHVFNSMLLGGNMLLSFIYVLKVGTNNMLIKALLLFSILVSFIVMLSIGGRMSIFAVVLCLLLYALIFLGFIKFLYLLLGLSIVSCLVFFFNKSIYLRVEGLFKWNGYNPLFLRMIQWKCYIDTFLTHPIFGSGHVNTLETVHACYKQVGYADGVNNQYHSHNQFIEIATKYGIIGFFTFITLFLSNIWYSFRRKDYFLMVMVTFLLLINITENVFLSRHVGNIFFSFILFYMYFRKKLINE
ncbi:O-antigen ligase family protein [Algibacter pacificus]|uniref:O-antigen ligase family protein n=1 Tax=Algibacter pacificus TaxID=2599389 RepID=UPI001650BB6C|nr:O-antigen ligase family protein [Algibacter pacificus]